MTAAIEAERREGRGRRKCDLHDACVAEYTAEIKQINVKITQLCDMAKHWTKYSERLAAAEQKIGHHGDLIKEGSAWRKEHMSFADKSIEKQTAKDDAMQDDINGLKVAMAELTTAIVQTKADLKEYFRKPLIAAAIGVALTCASAVGVLIMFVLQILAKAKGFA